MARKRPTASDVPQIPADPQAIHRVRDAAGRVVALSHAQARALRRCTPLTSAEFEPRTLGADPPGAEINRVDR